MTRLLEVGKMGEPRYTIEILTIQLLYDVRAFTKTILDVFFYFITTLEFDLQI